MASADRLIEVFNEAKTRPTGAERDHFLAEACLGDAALKEQVISLLDAHEGAGAFLQHTQLASATSVLTEKPGDKIGRYKLLQQIGEGGCGVVYMAEQEEPVRRRVALKVIKLGMEVISARFSPDGKRIVTASADTTARVWDAGNGQPLTDPFKHLLPVIEAQFSPDGRQIATVAGQAAMVWDIAPAQPEYPYWLLTLSEAISGQVLNKRARVHRKSNQRKHPGLP